MDSTMTICQDTKPVWNNPQHYCYENYGKLLYCTRPRSMCSSSCYQDQYGIIIVLILIST